MYEPSKETDLLNLVYMFLKLKRFKVSPEPEPVEVLGKTHFLDLSVDGQVAIKWKISKRRGSVIRAIHQAELYAEPSFNLKIFFEL